jgi:hypothetical protein
MTAHDRGLTGEQIGALETLAGYPPVPAVMPLSIGLSGLLPIGGAPLAVELSAFLGVCVGH